MSLFKGDVDVVLEVENANTGNQIVGGNETVVQCVMEMHND